MLKTIKIFGDRYKIRQTFDIGDFGMDIYGYEVYNENEIFLRYVEGICNLKDLRSYLKSLFYKCYKGIYSYNSKR